MANFDTSDAAYNAELRKFETTDPVHADTFNQVAEQLIKNDVAIRNGSGLSAVSAYSDSYQFMILTPDGPALVNKADLIRLAVPNNAGAHNCIYRGKYLGDHVTDAQFAAIKNGTFDDLFLGDYWTIGGQNWRIWGFDWGLRIGDSEFGTHAAVIMPDGNILNADGSTTHYMNSKDTTEGGYAGTVYRSTYRATCKSTIASAFGSSHIGAHRELISNAVTNGQASGWAWTDCDVELPSEIMMYGSCVWGNSAQGGGSGYNCGSAYPILPLTAIAPQFVRNRANYWLRDVASASNFARVNNNGYAYSDGASNAWVGVRPYFFLV